MTTRIGDRMITGAFILFLFSALFCAAGFWFYGNADQQATQKFVERDSIREAELKRLDTIILGNISTISQTNAKLATLEDTVKSLEEQMDVFRDQVSDNITKQHKLELALARKKQSHKVNLTGSIPIEVYNNPSPRKAKIPAVPPPSPDIIKEIKDQIKGLNR